MTPTAVVVVVLFEGLKREKWEQQSPSHGILGPPVGLPRCKMSRESIDAACYIINSHVVREAAAVRVRQKYRYARVGGPDRKKREREAAESRRRGVPAMSPVPRVFRAVQIKIDDSVPQIAREAPAKNQHYENVQFASSVYIYSSTAKWGI